MKVWWAGLASRERQLILLAVGLTVMVVFWQFVLNPTLNARDKARIAWSEADARLAQLQEAYIAKRARGDNLSMQMPGTEYRGNAFKMAVSRAATDQGLVISRLQGSGDDSFGLVFEKADPRLIFLWLEHVETRLGGQIRRLTLEQAGRGEVRARVDIQSFVAGQS